MTSKKAVNLDNLATLGAQCLAGILMDLANQNPDTKRRLRLELT